MPGYKPTQNAQDIKFSFELYGGPSSFSLVIPNSELTSYALGAEILIGNKYIGEVAERTKLNDYTYMIKGEGLKSSLTGTFFKGKYNAYDDESNLLPGAREITDVGSILDDIAGYISPLGISFDGTPPYVTVGVAPYECDISGSVYDIITHIAQAAGKGWYIDQSKKIKFADIVKYQGQEFEKEVSSDIVNVLIIKGNLKQSYLNSTSELGKFKYFTTITDNSGLFCPSGYIGLEYESEDPRFESPNKTFIFSDDASVGAYGRREVEVEVPYIDSNSEASDFAEEYFLNNASPIRSEISYTIDLTEEYPHTKGALKTDCRLLPTDQLRADYYFFSSEDSLYNTEFITWVKNNNKEKLINELDKIAPRVKLIESEPVAHTKTYKKIKSPIYLGCYAKDDNPIDTAKFYLSKYDTQQSSWGAYTLIGDGTYQNPPDSESEGYYEYDQSNGYYDLIISGGLVRGDIFRIKSVSKDLAGNAGEDIKEYQLDADPPAIHVSVDIPDTQTEQFNAPSVIEVSSAEGFRLKIIVDDQSVLSTPTCTYSNQSVSVSKVDSGDEHYYITDNISKPNKGEYKVAVITVTNQFGKETKSVHYVKGVEKQGLGNMVSVKDPSTSASGDTASIPEFTDQLEFLMQFKDDFYKVTAADVKFKIYSVSGTLVKTLTDLTTPAITESPVGSGIFKCTSYVGTVSEGGIGLSDGIYSISAEVTKKETYIDELGVSHDGSYVQEGEKTQFQIAGITTYYDHKNTKAKVTDHDTRLPSAEKGAKHGWNDGQDDVTSEVKFFSSGAPDSGGPGWFVTKDNRFSSNWIRVSADQTGTPDNEFTINNDQSSGQYITLTFSTDTSGSDIGKIRYDQTNKKIEMSVDDGTNWTDVATGVSDSILKDVSGTTYKLRVDATTGDLIFNDGTNNLFKVATTGTVTVYSDILPGTDDSYDLGGTTKKFANAYIGNVTYTMDTTFTDDGGTTEYGKLESDAVNNQVIPHNIAIGFMDG
jgi:hypothetical protein